MSYNINDMCRVCLVPTGTRKNSNLFFSSGRSVQLWAKVMACAWVQVFEGDGLPSQICYKCHNKLDIAYQFKQQCEAADAQIRQFLNRTVTGKGPPNNIDLTLTQSQPECLAECKPLNFNITSECLDLAQSDLSLSAYRLMSQDISLSQQLDFRLRDSDFAAMKQEPGLLASLNLFNPLPLSKGDCQVSSSFKCESFNDNDIMLDSLPAKLFESVSDSMNPSSADDVDQIDCKISVWDLQHKDPTPSIHKDDFVIHGDKENPLNKEKEILRNVCDSEDLSFLADDRSVSPLTSKIVEPPCIIQGRNDVLTIPDDLQNHTDYLSKSDKDAFDKNSQIIEETVTALKATFPDEMQTITKRPRKKVNKENQDVKKSKKSTVKKPNSEKKEEQEQCELCGKVFKYRSYMIQHLRTHTGVKPYDCSYCDQKFTMYHTLVTHLRTHSGDRPYICAVCGKGFTQSTGLKSHMRAHTGEKPFECEICGKKFSQKSNLLIHKQIHSGQREHICVVCHVAFKFYKHLQSHMKLHSDQKEFKCSVCQKSFHRKSYLRTHLSIHSGERPYRCEECGHTFTNSSNLKAHLRIHSGIKPYKCKVCKKAFIQSSGLNRHMQQHSFAQTAN